MKKTKKKVVKLKVHYHYETDNESFIIMYKILKELGIKNNKFFLKIYDEDIKGLNPFDEDNLTVEQKIKIRREVKRNLWYFLREIVRIPVPGGSTRYKIHRGNLALTYCLQKNRDIYIELPRQNYKTQSFLCFIEWIYDFGTKYSEMAFLHKKYDDSKLNLDRLKKIRELLPSYLLPEKTADDTYNLTKIENKYKNSIVAKNSAVNEEQADLLGRGNTTPVIMYDEMAFIKYLQIIYTAAAPSQSQARLEAIENGKYAFKACLSTPGDIKTEHGEYCKNSIIGQAAIFDEHIYDWDDNKIDEYLAHNSDNDVIYIKFSYKQLGRSEKWFKDQCRALNNDVSKINREILLQWNRGTELSPFTTESIDRLRQYAKDPIATVPIHENYLLKIYEDFDWTMTLLIGGDFGGSSSKDYTAFSIVNPFNMHVVADFKNNKADPIECADIIYELMSKFFPNSVFIPEENSYSKAAISLLLRTECANRVYYEYKDKINETKMDNGIVKKEKVKTKVYGVNTTKESRPLMIGLLFDIVEEDYENIISPEVIEDIAGLERNKKTNRIDHSSKSHDDSLFSYLLVRYVFAYGTNLARFKIYKTHHLKSEVEDIANRAVRSDEEYIRNFSSVLKANFSNNNSQYQSNYQRDLINEFNQAVARKREYEENFNKENNGMEAKSSVAKIFSLNKR